MNEWTVFFCVMALILPACIAYLVSELRWIRSMEKRIERLRDELERLSDEEAK